MNVRFLQITRLELIVIILTILCVAVGVAVSFINKQWFESVYVVEDGFIESLTVLALLGISCVMFSRFIRLYRERNRLFKTGLICIGMLGIFGAGEELSWGQRILDVESSEFFQNHNTQQETNVHNMIVNGKKINKIIFSKFLITVVLMYLVLIPILYKSSARFKKFADKKAGIPVPKFYHLALLLLLMLMTWASPSRRKDELLEFGASFTFLLVFSHPQNKNIFTKNIKPERQHVLK